MVNWITPLAAALTVWAVLAFWLMREMYFDSVETEQKQRLAMKFCGPEGGKALRVIHPAGAVKEPEWVILCTRQYEMKLQQEVPQGHLYP
jgi:hypothetical protein